MKNKAEQVIGFVMARTKKRNLDSTKGKMSRKSMQQQKEITVPKKKKQKKKSKKTKNRERVLNTPTVCNACHRTLPASAFSSNQKRKDASIRRCSSCVQSNKETTVISIDLRNASSDQDVDTATPETGPKKRKRGYSQVTPTQPLPQKIRVEKPTIKPTPEKITIKSTPEEPTKSMSVIDLKPTIKPTPEKITIKPTPEKITIKSTPEKPTKSMSVIDLTSSTSHELIEINSSGDDLIEAGEIVEDARPASPAPHEHSWVVAGHTLRPGDDCEAKFRPSSARWRPAKVLVPGLKGTELRAKNHICVRFNGYTDSISIPPSQVRAAGSGGARAGMSGRGKEGDSFIGSIHLQFETCVGFALPLLLTRFPTASARFAGLMSTHDFDENKRRGESPFNEMNIHLLAIERVQPGKYRQCLITPDQLSIPLFWLD